jgi:transposase
MVRARQNIAAVAQTLGIADQMLHKWGKADEQGKFAVRSAKPVRTNQMKISQLRAELARAKMERDILGIRFPYFA